MRKLILAALAVMAFSAPAQYLTETNYDVVTNLVYVPYGTNHYTMFPWWMNTTWDDGHGTTNLDGGSVGGNKLLETCPIVGLVTAPKLATKAGLTAS